MTFCLSILGWEETPITELQMGWSLIKNRELIPMAESRWV